MNGYQIYSRAKYWIATLSNSEQLQVSNHYSTVLPEHNNGPQSSLEIQRKNFHLVFVQPLVRLWRSRLLSWTSFRLSGQLVPVLTRQNVTIFKVARGQGTLVDFAYPCLWRMRPETTTDCTLNCRCGGVLQHRPQFSEWNRAGGGQNLGKQDRKASIPPSTCAPEAKAKAWKLYFDHLPIEGKKIWWELHKIYGSTPNTSGLSPLAAVH